MNRQLLRKRDHYSSFQKKSNKFFSHPVSSRNCAILNEIMEIMENWCGKMALRFLWHGAYVVQLSGFRFPCIPPNRHCLLCTFIYSFKTASNEMSPINHYLKQNAFTLWHNTKPFKYLQTSIFHLWVGSFKNNAQTLQSQQEEASFAAAVASNCVKELIQYVFI